METWMIVALGTALLALLPIAWKLLDGQIAKVKNGKLRAALNEIADAAEEAAEAALETAVAEAKKKSKGKLTKAAGQKIKEEVVESAIKSVSRSSTKVLVKEFADDELKEKVGNFVEVGLGRIKDRRGLRKKK